MSRIEEVRKAMMEALKAGNKPQKDALSLLLSALKAKQIDKHAELTEDEENAVVYKEIKEAQETLDTTPAERADILEECRLRIHLWSEFAPARMSEADIRQVIDATLKDLNLTAPTPQDKGRLMKTLMPKLSGKADGRLVNQLVSERLK